jgi:hypothetical protein
MSLLVAILVIVVASSEYAYNCRLYRHLLSLEELNVVSTVFITGLIAKD